MSSGPAADASPTGALAGFASALQYDALPPPVRQRLTLLALDTLGCCLQGAGLPWTLRVRRLIVGEAGREAATVLGTRLRVPAPGAALVNATAGHGFEMDDIHRDAVIHAGSLVFPVALALAEEAGGASGREFLSAVAAGYEVGLRVGAAAGQSLLLQGFHPQGTSGAFAAAAAAARMLALDPHRTRHALGIAGSLGAGLMAAQEGAMVKRLHAGHAARVGVEAARLAAGGFTGIEHVVEAEYGGFLATHAPAPDPDRLWAGLGEHFELLEVGVKPFATVTSIHTSLEALRALMSEHGLLAEDIAGIRAGVSPATYAHCAWRYRGQSLTAAQMNLYFGLAVMALHGDAGAAQITEDRVNDAGVMKLIGRIEAYVDPEIGAAGPSWRHAARIEVKTRDGRRYERFEKHRLGSPEKPLPEHQIRAKFRANAGTILSEAAIARLERLIDGLEELEDVAVIAEACGEG